MYFPGYYERQPTVVVVEKEATAQPGTQAPADLNKYLLIGLGATVLVLGAALILRR